MSIEKTNGLVCVVALVFSGVAFGQTQVPNTFQAGQPARAAEVNDNFDALEAAVDQNAAAIQQIPAGPQGDPGPQGIQGIPGAQGPQGPAGPSLYFFRYSAGVSGPLVNTNPGGLISVSVLCDVGDLIVSGNVSPDDLFSYTGVRDNFGVRGFLSSVIPVTSKMGSVLGVWVVCADKSEPNRVPYQQVTLACPLTSSVGVNQGYTCAPVE